MNKEDILLHSIFFENNRDEILKLGDTLDIEYDGIDEDGDEMISGIFDMSKFKQYIDIVLNSKKIQKIYEDLLDGEYYTSSVDLQDVLRVLCIYYVKGHYNKQNPTYNIIRDKDFKFIYKFFKSNDFFACSLIINYYLAKIYNVDRMRINPPKDLLDKFDYQCKIMFITDHIRFKYEECVNEIMSYGISQEDTVKYIFLTLIGKNDEIDDIGLFKEIDFLVKNKRLITRLIYADVFEDITNWDLRDPHINYLMEYICYTISTGKYIIPNSELGLEMVDRFTDLIFDPALREYNRNSLDDYAVKILHQANPVYKLERVMIGYEDK